MGTPLKFSDEDARERPLTPAPVLGEHTAEVLSTVGIDGTELARLRTNGVI